MSGQVRANAAVKLPLEAWLAVIDCLPWVDQRRLAPASLRSHRAIHEARWQFHEDIVHEDVEEERFRAEYGTELPEELIEAWLGTP